MKLEAKASSSSMRKNMTILFALTSQNKFGSTATDTGVWFEEFLSPYYFLKDAGLSFTVATPMGGSAPIDPASIEALDTSELYGRYLEDRALQHALANTRKLSDLDPEEIAAVIYPGGYGPMFDLRYDAASIDLIAAMVRTGKPVATICHAGCVLLDVKTDSGLPLVSGLNLTCFSDSEEEEVSMVSQVPYLVESELRKLGAVFTQAPNWRDHCVKDGFIITGQNPASSISVAKAVLDLVRTR
jgi:putative intracellular protease/amidase